MSLFFCQFLSAVGVFKKDCRHILRSCRLSVKPLGRPLWWRLCSLAGSATICLPILNRLFLVASEFLLFNFVLYMKCLLESVYNSSNRQTGKANERMKPAKSLLKWTFGDKILYSVWMVSIPSVSILSCLWWFGLICRWSKAIFMSLFQCLFLVHCYILIITRFEADFKMRSSIPMIFPIVFLYLWTQS